MHVKNNIITILAPVIAILLSSCGSTSNSSEGNDFLKREIQQYIKRNEHKPVTQYINRQNKLDTVELSPGKLEKHLALFTHYAIDSSKSSRYKIQRTGNTKIEGEAKESGLPLNKFSIHKENTKLKHLVFEVDDINQLYEMKYHLELKPEGYLIKAIQNVDWAFQDSCRIEGVFVK